MKLVSIREHGELCIGLYTPMGVLNLTHLPSQMATDPLPETMESLIAGGPHMSNLRRFEEKLANSMEFQEFLVPEEQVDYAPCITSPGKIVCVGMNYRNHAIESNMPIPTTPVLFSKFNNSLSGHRGQVHIPEVTRKLDYEVELVMVIGEYTSNVSERDALAKVFGYCTGNDLSARDLQFRTGQWLLGKTCDGFAPLGPYLMTSDEVPEPNSLGLESRVNGEIRQNSNTADMIFSCAEIVSYVSRHMTLNPGDVIFTGTPEGVIMGYPEHSQRWLQAGDTVEVSVETLGTLTTHLA